MLIQPDCIVTWQAARSSGSLCGAAGLRRTDGVAAVLDSYKEAMAAEVKQGIRCRIASYLHSLGIQYGPCTHSKTILHTHPAASLPTAVALPSNNMFIPKCTFAVTVGFVTSVISCGTQAGPGPGHRCFGKHGVWAERMSCWLTACHVG